MHDGEWVFVHLVVLVADEFTVNIGGDLNQFLFEGRPPWNPVLFLLLNMLVFHVSHVVEQVEESLHYVLADILSMAQLLLVVVLLIEEFDATKGARLLVKQVLLPVVGSIPFFGASRFGKTVL